jgi:hypothetical protein
MGPCTKHGEFQVHSGSNRDDFTDLQSKQWDFCGFFMDFEQQELVVFLSSMNFTNNEGYDRPWI